MEFNTGYNSPMDRGVNSSPNGYFGDFDAPQQQQEPQIESSVKISELGQSVTEGARFGSFIKTSQEAIRKGAGTLELSTNMGGGQEAVGAEAYGEDARQALREIARINEVKIVSIHSPVNIGNMSGFNQQEKGFSDEHRKMQMEEVKKAIEFAADTAGQGAVVVHTGEYQRDMSDESWGRNPDGSYKFLSFDEEPHRQVKYLVDERTGKLISEVRKSMVVREPDFETKWDASQNRDRWVDKDGEFLDDNDLDDLFKRVPKHDAEKTRFETRRLTWKDFEKRAEEWNRYHPKKANGFVKKWTPEEMYFRSQMETRILQARGSSLFHGRTYVEEKKDRDEMVKLRDYFKKIEKDTPIEEQWRLLEESRISTRSEIVARYGEKKRRLPSEILDEDLKKKELDLKYTHESSASADAQADESEETMRHVVTVSDFAKQQTANSYGEAGIHAMEQSQKNPNATGDIFIAPENIFPEMGYGSHPEELISLVKDGRKQMVKLLTSKEIKSQHGEMDDNGNLKWEANPHYTGMNKSEAEDYASRHIKATLDTQHLGMWWKNFQPLPGETKDKRKERFDKWYMEQIDRLADEDIIGHIHVVDGMGGGHHHLPVGQGDLPVKDAVEYLKKKGFGGTMISEAHGEEQMHGVGRMLTETWKAFGNPIQTSGYSSGSPGMSGGSWGSVHQTYFNQMQSPYFIFGAYSPSNDWQFWSQVPVE